MYLKSLTLKGFKSFADRTHMKFDPGLNVVVGPNGSGKSNVSDAVLWVLGEQSAKMLRGQAMEDVIFSGSSARQPVGLAEVSLVLDNEDHTLPIDFSEVAITRRMYRSGESEYLVNGAPSRLRDIQDILHDSGLGKDTHSIISQGKLDSILSGRPEERRELIEEAAGISKHRRRKERAERKLQAMDVNLTRAKDIQRVLMRQLRPLERQAQHARQYRELTEEFNRLTTIRAVDDLRQLQATHRTLVVREKEADAAVEIANFRLEEHTRELDKLQNLLEQKGVFVGDLDEQRRRMQDLLGRMDADMRLLEEKGKNMVARLSEMRMQLSTMEKQRIDAQRAHELVVGDLAATRGTDAALHESVSERAAALDALTARRRKLGGEVGRLSSEQKKAQRDADTETLAYARLRDQIESAEATDELYAHRLARIIEQLSQTEAACREGASRKEIREEELAQARSVEQEVSENIAACQMALDHARSADQQARRLLSHTEADLAATEALDRASENQSELVAHLAASEESSRIRCRLADVMVMPSEVEPIVETLLGDDLAALVVAGNDDVVALMHAASETHLEGIATIVACTSVLETTEEAALPGISLSQLAHPLEGYEGLVHSLFGSIRLVESASQALAAHESYPALTFVARDGVIVQADGRTSVGHPAQALQGSFERKRRVRELNSMLPQQQTDVETCAHALADAEMALAQARDDSTHAKGEVARLAAEVSSLSSELGRLTAQRDAAQAEKDHVEQARQSTAEKVEHAREEVIRHKQAADAAQAHARELADAIEELSSERNQAAADEREAQKDLTDEKLRLATAQERRNHLESRERELAHTMHQLEERIVATQQSAAALDVVRLRVDPLYDLYEALRASALLWSRRLNDRALLEEANSDSLKKTISDARTASQTAASELSSAKEEASALRVELGKVEVEVKHAVEAITATGQILEEALTLPAPVDREADHRRMEELRRSIEGLGPVNEVAMEEYERLKERSDYIASQVEDLERARSALRKITAAIERKMRLQFLSVFDQVNTHFSEVFEMLFPGGHAHLEMTDPDHLDETGIDIQAQPRGKRIAKMMLMSGGEKSLTALALLFAVYKTRTVPFYIFDEVEAALDNANLTKLLKAIEQLKATTQLIVISHQRRTMEQADVLYGVSMRADGVSRVVSQRLDRTTGKVVDA